jgi:hypothetical protein
VRTWEENKTAINQLWPSHEWSDEEAKLVREDLSPLDQPTLYDAIRNAKRKHDTPFVHLKWLLDEYRELSSSKRHALKASKPKDPKLEISIDDDLDRRLAADFVSWIDDCDPEHFGDVETKVLDKLPQMHSLSAVKVLSYARSRLLGQETQFGRVTKSGDIEPIQVLRKEVT